jgi:hypothetical protein
MVYSTEKIENNDNINQFNNGVLQLINLNKIYEELINIFNENYNIIIIDLDYNEVDLACPYILNGNNGLCYMVYAETFPNFKNTFSFIDNEKKSDKYGICYNVFNNHNLVNIKTNAKIELLFSLKKFGDLIRHFKILNEFKTSYEYQIMVGYGLQYINLGTFNTNSTNKIVLKNYINMLGQISMYHNICVKIIIDTEYENDWKTLKMLTGYVYIDTDTLKKLSYSSELYINI